MRRYDRIGKWHNYWAVNPLLGEKQFGSVDLTSGARWVIYYPEVTVGNTNPFEEDEDPEIDEHDTTPVVELAEYVVDDGNDDKDDDSDADLSEEDYEEPE